MAKANILGLQDQFNCSICLDLIKNPVTLQCGHSFCMKCINACWDQEDQKVVYSCPQCRQTFTPRPAVSKNTMLADIVETLKKAGVQPTPPAQCSAGPEDVECDSCTERKHKAIKSCLVCLASFCETHLQPHYKSPAFKKHKLVEASRRLQEQICSQHGKLLEVYCRTDQQCICMLCAMDQHKGHDTVSAAAERAEKQKQLLEKIQEGEEQHHKLTKAVVSHMRSAQKALQEHERIFSDLITKRRCEVTALIRAQKKAVVSRADAVFGKLKQEMAELKRRDAKMKELSYMEDPIYFLQNFKSMGCDVPTITLHSLLNFKNAIKPVSQLRRELEELCKDQIMEISSQANCASSNNHVDDRAAVGTMKVGCSPQSSTQYFQEKGSTSVKNDDDSYPGPAKRRRTLTLYPHVFTPIGSELSNELKPVCYNVATPTDFKVSVGTQTDESVSVGTQTDFTPALSVNRRVFTFMPLTSQLPVAVVFPQRVLPSDM
ncbi:E3 ubiquitin/ISG15 ligase TRIM25-like [Clarias gariepinus]